jgi:hypothetical protein
MKLAYAVIADVANQQCTVPVENDAMRLSKLCLNARPAIARKPGQTRTRDCRNHSGLHVYLADNVVVAFRNVQIALAVEQ